MSGRRRRHKVSSQPLPLTTAYFYGPVSVSENHMVKMCSNNLFGDGSVRFMAAAINAADGSVLVAREMSLPRRGGECLTFRTTEPLDMLGVLWSLGGTWGDFTWSSARASGPLASLQVVDVDDKSRGRDSQHTGEGDGRQQRCFRPCRNRNKVGTAQTADHVDQRRARSASMRAKRKYAHTVTELITTPIRFQAITGRDVIKRP